MIDRKPAVVVRCLGVADVIACVQFAREHDLLLCIKGGGHNIAGLATADGALMLDLSLMRGVWVDPQRKVAHAQAGCLLGDVDRETQVHGLAAVLGFVSLTGIAGLTLGGGFGYLTRRWGWTSDNVVGMDVVTADARLVRASSDENAGSLLGAARRRRELRRRDRHRLRALSGRSRDRRRRRRLARKRGARGARAVPHARRDRPRPNSRSSRSCGRRPLRRGCRRRCTASRSWPCSPATAGDPRRARRRSPPIKAFGKPIGDVLVRRPYAQMQSLLDATQPKGRRYYWKSEYLPRIEPALCEKVIEHAARIRSPHSAVILFQIEGALNRLEEEHSPVGNRDARYVLNMAGSWEQAERRHREHRLGARGLERHEVVLDRRHVHQLPDRGRRPRAHRGGARQGARAARRGQGEMGSAERVPHQPQHQTGNTPPTLSTENSESLCPGVNLASVLMARRSGSKCSVCFADTATTAPSTATVTGQTDRVQARRSLNGQERRVESFTDTGHSRPLHGSAAADASSP